MAEQSVNPRIVVLAGDGIGPEIVAAARTVLDAIGTFDYDEQLIGGISIDESGSPLTDEALAACSTADAVLLGAVGGPKWDTTDPDQPRPEQGLLGLRKGLGLYANLRPVKPQPALIDASPLRRERIEGTDLLVVRELTGGFYFGRKERKPSSALDECVYDADEITRIARTAFEAARRRSDEGRVTSVDKANVLETSRLWREVVSGLAGEYPNVALDHLLVDNAAMQLVSDPSQFDVIVTENMFGDILSDEAAMITGSLGMLPSASLGDGGPGVFEPVHGSAPISPARAPPTRSQRFSRRPCCSATGSATARARPGSRPPSRSHLPGDCGLPTSSPAPRARSRVGTAEMTAAVIAALG